MTRRAGRRSPYGCLNDGLKIVDGFPEPLLDFGGPRPRDGALQREAHGEQALDDVVVQVAGDAVAVGEHVELAHPALRAGQLPGQGGLVGERGHHVELFVAERLRADGPQRDQDTGDGLGCAKRQDQRRAGRVDLAGDLDAVETSGQCARRKTPRWACRLTGKLCSAEAGPSPDGRRDHELGPLRRRQLGIIRYRHQCRFGTAEVPATRRR